MRHSSNVLKIGGKLIVYGPFIVKGIMPDNISLLNDKLKEQSLEYGIRDLENVIQSAKKVNLHVISQQDLP